MKEATVIRGMLHTAAQGGVGFDAPSIDLRPALALRSAGRTDGRSAGANLWRQFQTHVAKNGVRPSIRPSIPISFFTPPLQM